MCATPTSPHPLAMHWRKRPKPLPEITPTQRAKLIREYLRTHTVTRCPAMFAAVTHKVEE